MDIADQNNDGDLPARDYREDIEQADAALGSRDYARADDLLSNLLDHLPPPSERRRPILVRLADVCERMGEHRRALEFWAKVRSEFDFDNRGWRRAAALCMSIGDTSEAVRLWEGCIRQFSDDIKDPWVDALTAAYVAHSNSLHAKSQTQSHGDGGENAFQLNVDSKGEASLRALIFISSVSADNPRALRRLERLASTDILRDARFRQTLLKSLYQHGNAPLLSLVATEPIGFDQRTGTDVTVAAALRRWGYVDEAVSIFDEILAAGPNVTLIPQLTSIVPVIFNGADADHRRRMLVDLADAAPQGWGDTAKSLSVRVALVRNLIALGECERAERIAAEIALEDPGRADDLTEYLARQRRVHGGGKSRPKVFVIGLSKTGTTSMVSALRSLGYYSAHWVNPITGDILDWDDFEVFDALGDTSVAWRFEDLAERYPDAKFIYTERPLESWAKSFETHLRKYHQAQSLSDFQASLKNPNRHQMGEVFLEMNKSLYSGKDVFACFQSYKDRVMEYFSGDKSGRLLSFNMFEGDGFGELCAFLDLPSPGIDFPWENRADGDTGKGQEAVATADDGVDPMRKQLIEWFSAARRAVQTQAAGDLLDIADSIRKAADIPLPGWSVARARELVRRRRYDEAEQAYLKAVEDDPQALAPILGLAKLHSARGAARAAVECFETVFERQPLLRRYREHFAPYTTNLVKIGRWKEALGLIDEAIVDFPNDPAIVTLKIELLLMVSDIDGARIAYRSLDRRFGRYAIKSAGLRYRVRRGVGRRDYWPENRPVETEHDAAIHLGLQIASEGRAKLRDLGRAYMEQFPGSRRLKAVYIQRMCQHLGSEAERQEVIQLAREITADDMASETNLLAAARGLVFSEEAGLAAEVLERIRFQQGDGAYLADLQAAVSAQLGDSGAAAVHQRAHLENTYIRALHADIGDLKLISPERGGGQENKIIVVAYLKNERPYLPQFFESYRALGIDHFFIVDNGSTDGTCEFCTEQPDATVFRTRSNFYMAGSGMRWINFLIDRYGAGNWCLFVDADEELVLPGMETRGLRALLDGASERGEEMIAATMVDMFPAELHAGAPVDPQKPYLEQAPWFDPRIFFFGNSTSPGFSARGGIRTHRFDTSESLEKVPLIWGSSAVRYLDNHSTTLGRLSELRGAILHYSLLRNSAELAGSDDIAALPRFNDRSLSCQLRYRRYNQLIRNGAEADARELTASVKYASNKQLEDLAILQDRPAVTPPSQA